jgi:hypothetical protein
MRADNLFRLPAAPDAPIIAAINPFQPGLFEFQQEEPFARDILTWHHYGNAPNKKTSTRT